MKQGRNEFLDNGRLSVRCNTSSFQPMTASVLKQLLDYRTWRHPGMFDSILGCQGKEAARIDGS